MPVFQKKIMLILAVLLSAECGAFFIKYCLGIKEIAKFGGDYLIFFRTGHLLAQHNFSAIYDTAPLQKAIAMQVTGDFGLVAPFTYPPYALFAIWPLGFLSYGAGVVLWSLLPLPFYFGLVALLVKRSLPAPGAAVSFACAFTIATASVLPLYLANVFCGQTGNSMAVLILSALYFWKRRPLLCGLCIGLLTIKPQLGLLFPFALLAGRQWLALLAALTVTCLLILASLLCFGAGMWVDYLHMMQCFTAYLNASTLFYSKIALAPYVSLRAAGLPAGLAMPLQIAGTCLFAGLVIRAIRCEGGPLDIRLGLMACAIPLVTPYTLCYDTPLLAGAVIPLLMRALARGWRSVLEIFAFIAVLLMPYAQPLALTLHIPFEACALVLLFMTLYRLWRAEARG